MLFKSDIFLGRLEEQLLNRSIYLSISILGHHKVVSQTNELQIRFSLGAIIFPVFCITYA